MDLRGCEEYPKKNLISSSFMSDLKMRQEAGIFRDSRYFMFMRRTYLNVFMVFYRMKRARMENDFET